jgi:hypothetical protein
MPLLHVAQSEHVLLFVELLNEPARHRLHDRSEVELGSAVSYSPALHTVCLSQELRPASLTNEPSAHGWQASEFSVPEKRPAGQDAQIVLSMNVPGLQMPQYPFEAPPQPLRLAPVLHVLQVVQLL